MQRKKISNSQILDKKYLWLIHVQFMEIHVAPQAKRGVLSIGAWATEHAFQCKRSTPPYPTEHVSISYGARLLSKQSTSPYPTEHSSIP